MTTDTSTGTLVSTCSDGDFSDANTVPMRPHHIALGGTFHFSGNSGVQLKVGLNNDPPQR
jgi:hypothetical protein